MRFRDRRHRVQRRRGARCAEGGARRRDPARRRNAGASGLEAFAGDPAHGRGARVLIVSSMAEEGAETPCGRSPTVPPMPCPSPASAIRRRFAECSPNGLAGSAGPSARPRRSHAIPPPARSTLRAMPNGPLGCVALGASTAGFTPCSNFCALCRPRSARAPRHQHLPAVFMPYFARQLESASGRVAQVAGEGDVLGRRSHPLSRPATPICASNAAALRSASGSIAPAPRPAACRRPIRCSHRSPTLMAMKASAYC